MEMGVPKDEIAFIHSYHSEERKLALYEKVNEGKIRILIGSTFKLGIGANVQTKLKAIHHLDVPWRPADMVQREGRILRRGNTNDNVYIYRYICEGSFDSYSWQILETKQRFISQFLKGNTYQRSAEDLEENVLNYAEVKALALCNPKMKELAETENILANKRILSGKYMESKNILKSEYESLIKEIDKAQFQYDHTIENIESISYKTKQDYTYARTKLAVLLTTENLKKEGKVIGDIWEFNILVPKKQNEKKPYLLLDKNGARYQIEIGKSSSGNATRILNYLQELGEYNIKLEKLIQKKKLSLAQTEAEMSVDNPYISEIKKLEAKVAVLKNEIYKEYEKKS